jgi:uncharacterized MAPEG superfamily protein
VTVLLWSVAAACLLPYLAATAQTVAKFQQHGTYENAAPRAQTARLTGYGQRAMWAQANSWEAFALFSAAAFTVQLVGADGERASALAVTFIAARVLYIAAYLADIHWLRSTLWTVGVACIVGLFGLAAFD